MEKYPIIAHALRAMFNSADGLSEDVSTRLYVRAFDAGGQFNAFRTELERAFQDDSLSWKDLLSNEQYEIIDASSEVEAREHARRLLWKPLFDGASQSDRLV